MVLCGKMEIVAGLPEGSRIRDELVVSASFAVEPEQC